MRELIARGILVLTFAIILGVSVFFALRHNRPAAPPIRSNAVSEQVSRVTSTPLPAPVTPPAVPGATDKGRRVFGDLGCATCHAIEGSGNPRSPLDGVGSRRSRAELRMWITATGSATAELPAGIQKRKQRYQSVPEEDLVALVDYLSTLTTPSK